MDNPRETPSGQLPAEFDRLRTPSPSYAPRNVAVYLCTREHLVSVPFAADVEAPENWECRCGQPASLVPANRGKDDASAVVNGEPPAGDT